MKRGWKTILGKSISFRLFHKCVNNLFVTSELPTSKSEMLNSNNNYGPRCICFFVIADMRGEMLREKFMCGPGAWAWALLNQKRKVFHLNFSFIFVTFSLFDCSRMVTSDWNVCYQGKLCDFHLFRMQMENYHKRTCEHDK